MRRKILRKLSRYIDKLYRKEHLKIHKNAIKCTNCNEWYSLSGINHKHHIEDTEFGYFTCEQEAHKAWIKRKLELVKELAAIQTDTRVAEALSERYTNY